MNFRWILSHRPTYRAVAIGVGLLLSLTVPQGTGQETLPLAEEVLSTELEKPPEDPQEILADKVTAYLNEKKSPLADHTDFLIQQKHWKLLVGISAIESRFCTRVAWRNGQPSRNCWGIGGDSAYRYYNSYEESIADADALIEKWQQRGRWLTVESMVGSYVVPGSPSWVATVKRTMAEIEEIIK